MSNTDLTQRISDSPYLSPETKQQTLSLLESGDESTRTAVKEALDKQDQQYAKQMEELTKEAEQIVKDGIATIRERVMGEQQRQQKASDEKRLEELKEDLDID